MVYTTDKTKLGIEAKKKNAVNRIEWIADKNSRHKMNLRNKTKKWREKRERGEDGERKAMGKLFRSANKEPLRDHEGNSE